MKEVEEERGRYQRTSSSQQIQIDKYKKLAEEAKGKTDSLENQLTAVKKVIKTALLQLSTVTSNDLTCMLHFDFSQRSI